jgi:hypothetical protein
LNNSKGTLVTFLTIIFLISNGNFVRHFAELIDLGIFNNGGFSLPEQLPAIEIDF